MTTPDNYDAYIDAADLPEEFDTLLSYSGISFETLVWLVGLAAFAVTLFVLTY